MNLHKFTQEEFDALPENELGGKICPTGDYTEIEFFPAYSQLGNECELGDRCELGNWCKLGDRCELGDRCKLGNWCELGELVRIGANTSYESGRVRNGTFVTVGRIGSKNCTAYFYIDENGAFFVRAGCWFSGADEFVEHVQEVHGGTIYETQYLAALDYAKAVLPGMLKEVTHDTQ